MGMMDSIAASSTGLSQAQLGLSYATAMTKKSMDNQEQMAAKMLEMLPPTPGKGDFIDVYA